MTERVAFLGVGNMGGRMARRLLAAGYDLSAYDPSPGALSALASEGARPGSSPLDAARGAEVVICSLPTAEIVESVVVGPAGVAEVLDPGATVIDMSTTDPATARRVAAALSSRGVNFLDAPVSRGVSAAAAGTLAIMVGGDEEVLESCLEMLGHLGSDVVHAGPVGSGQMTKLCNNMMAAVIMQGLAETLVAGVRAGLSIDVLTRVMSMSSGGS